MPIPENGESRGIVMWNKIILFCLICGLTCSLAAQNYRASRRNRNRRGTQNISVQPQKAEPQPKKGNIQSVPVAASKRRNPPMQKFDPSKPELTEAKVKKILEEKIRKNLLEKEIASTIKETTKDNCFSQSECRTLLWEYKILQNNFELSEVTRIKPEWYKRYGEELEKFSKIADAMYFALWKSSETDFENAIDQFRKQQEACLKFLKEKQPRLSSGEYQVLLKKNTKIRQQNYLKRLQSERDETARRRQEMLKQQEDKQKLLKYIKEHPEFFDEHPNFLKEHPEFQQYFPKAARAGSQGKTAVQDTAKKK